MVSSLEISEHVISLATIRNALPRLLANVISFSSSLEEGSI